MRGTELAQVTVSKHLMEHAFKTASSKIVDGGGITTTLDPWLRGSVSPYSSAQRKQKERETLASREPHLVQSSTFL